VQDRKTNLLAYAKGQNASIGDLNMQLSFLCSELETKFPDILEKLKNAASVREASDYVLIHFEAPADQSESVKAQRSGDVITVKAEGSARGYTVRSAEGLKVEMN